MKSLMSKFAGLCHEIWLFKICLGNVGRDLKEECMNGSEFCRKLSTYAWTTCWLIFHPHAPLAMLRIFCLPTSTYTLSETIYTTEIIILNEMNHLKGFRSWNDKQYGTLYTPEIIEIIYLDIEIPYYSLNFVPMEILWISTLLNFPAMCRI